MVSFSNIRNICSSIQEGRGESVCVCGGTWHSSGVDLILFPVIAEKKMFWALSFLILAEQFYRLKWFRQNSCEGSELIHLSPLETLKLSQRFSVKLLCLQSSKYVYKKSLCSFNTVMRGPYKPYMCRCTCVLYMYNFRKSLREFLSLKGPSGVRGWFYLQHPLSLKFLLYFFFFFPILSIIQCWFHSHDTDKA